MNHMTWFLDNFNKRGFFLSGARGLCPICKEDIDPEDITAQVRKELYNEKRGYVYRIGFNCPSCDEPIEMSSWPGKDADITEIERELVDLIVEEGAD